MSRWLEKYREYEVEVFYLTDSGFRDRGTLVDFGDEWLELHKRAGNGETFLIPITGVRMIRVVHAPTDDEKLLRPIDVPAHRIEENRRK
jgi:hypothetical protein